MPPFRRSASNKALLAEIWETRITIVSEQGAPYMRHKKGTHFTFSYVKSVKLHKKKDDMLQKLAFDCILRMVSRTSKYSGARLRLGASLASTHVSNPQQKSALVSTSLPRVVLAYI